MPHINLLPWREQAKQRKQKEYVAILALVAIAAFGVMLLVNTYYNGLISNQEMRNQYLRNEIAILDSQIAEIRELKDKRKNLEQRMGLITDLQTNRNLAAQIMDELVKVVPTGIFFVSLDKENNKLNIKGKSESNNRVSAMMRKVESSYLFELPTLSNIVSASPESRTNILSDFTMSIQVKTSFDKKSKSGGQ